jgi:uncharacterized protein
MQRVAALFLILLGFFIAAPARAADPARVEAVTIQTASGSFTFQAEIADTPALRERGLMFRHKLPENRAMLFDWGNVSEVAMWMKNTYIPLDMIFITKSGSVANVAENTVPFSETIIPSDGPVAGVLEVAAGTAKRIGLKPGDTVVHSMFQPAN